MTALRQKLIDELDLRGIALNTKENYIGAVYRLARHFKRSPDQISDEDDLPMLKGQTVFPRVLRHPGPQHLRQRQARRSRLGTR